MASRLPETPLTDDTERTVLHLVKSGHARSRTRIAHLAGLSPSTVAGRVERLIASGYLREAGQGASSGGRRPRHLEINPDKGVVCVIDLGATHATVGLFTFSGELIEQKTETIDIADGPSAIIAWASEQARSFATYQASRRPLMGIALAVPGPVDARTNRLISPSRMPGWNGVDAQTELERVSGLPAVVGNDANLAALGEARLRHESPNHMVYVKVGSSIGCGVVVDGKLYQGYQGVAGDISHISVPHAEQVLCTCGRRGCLDAVAGGRALVHSLQDEGVSVASSSDVVKLARDAHPRATSLLRQAGEQVGGVLVSIMNFFNPRSLVLGGTLGSSEAFMAGLQSAIYAECLPMVTGELLITTSTAKESAGIRGGAVALLDYVMSAPVTSHP